MAASATIYGNFYRKLIQSFFNDNNFKLALFDDSYTPDVNVDAYYADLTGEISGEGYTSGGKAVNVSSISYNETTGQVTVDADDISWTESTISVRYAVLYVSSLTNGPVVGYFDLGDTITNYNGTFELDINESGLLAAPEMD